MSVSSISLVKIPCFSCQFLWRVLAFVDGQGPTQIQSLDFLNDISVGFCSFWGGFKPQTNVRLNKELNFAANKIRRK